MVHEKKLKQLSLNFHMQLLNLSEIIQKFSEVKLKTIKKGIHFLELNFSLTIFKINFYQYFHFYEQLFLRVKNFEI